MSDSDVAAGGDENRRIDPSQRSGHEQISRPGNDQSHGAVEDDDHGRSVIRIPSNGQEESQSSDSRGSGVKSDGSTSNNNTVCKNNPLLKRLLFDDRSANEIIVQFPLGTVSVLFETEDKLKNDSRAYKCLMDKMFALAEFPKDHRAKIYALLKFLLNNELAAKISMFGTYSKLSFSSLKLYEILQKVILKHAPELTTRNIQLPIQRWLYNASRRLLLKKVCSCEDIESWIID